MFTAITPDEEGRPWLCLASAAAWKYALEQSAVGSAVYQGRPRCPSALAALMKCAAESNDEVREDREAAGRPT